MWSMNTIMNAGALGVEVSIAGKLRSERAHFEKHSSGVNPKSGDFADKIVRIGTTSVLTKMGLMGIQLRIALKNELPPEFELSESSTHDDSTQSQTAADVGTEVSATTPTVAGDVALKPTGTDGETVLAPGNTNGQT